MKSVQHLATKFSSMTSQASLAPQERVKKKTLFHATWELQLDRCIIQLIHGKPVAYQQVPCPAPPMKTALHVTFTEDLLHTMSLSSSVDTIEKATRH